MSLKPGYSVSKAALRSVVSTLNLQPGDVIVCKDYTTLDYLSKVHLPISFSVPLVFSPQGIEKLNRQDLLNLLEQLDAAEAPAPESVEMPTAPL